MAAVDVQELQARIAEAQEATRHRQDPPPGLPVPELLRGVLPDGLPVGAATAVRDRALLVALAAAALGDHGWAGVVAMPDLGLLAVDHAATASCIHRLLLVDEPAEQWPEIIAALAGGVDLILLGPPPAVGEETARRIGAVLRRTNCALLVDGAWPGAALNGWVSEPVWQGLGRGWGQLTGRSANVHIAGRGRATRERTVRLLLPGANGKAEALPRTASEREDGGALSRAEHG
ncbi:hypothetical protein BIV57_00510 [Mangrovactinospora gilvigrisea]|uniref:Recombinase A n=1 Tax=Mangrovactinospora gilvigrisea TaxID=1428644 RepID=A0A1J7BKY7_9ACTN|nr:hypothetical protein [Mangrovactinospora gilvigrisea]OIV39363.1 hypothetical protein BIV57_00510 [Mangrovactinospora gilvigrisea]